MGVSSFSSQSRVFLFYDLSPARLLVGCRFIGAMVPACLWSNEVQGVTTSHDDDYTSHDNVVISFIALPSSRNKSLNIFFKFN